MSMVLVSGGFDPLHDGHLDYLEGAKEHGLVLVALNSDSWIIRRKGRLFMPWSARARLLKALMVVHDVIQVADSDGTVCEALRLVRPDYFANGGDRIVPEPREGLVCATLGIIELLNVGGPKVRSSSSFKK